MADEANSRGGLDPFISLSAGMHAQPGVYALLLGSGTSTGAGIPTGWGVVQELVRLAAAAADPADDSAAEAAAVDPEQWWARHGDGNPLGYSGLLAALASTPAARRGLLAGFFEPDDEDREAGLKVPGPAHHAIAGLVKRGLVKVIVTTNFDRLIERALEDVGISPQVLARPEAVTGLTPLQHAAATVIKLHGDYADIEMRNTVEELNDYPSQLAVLLQRIFDEYGLVICGWSGDWDGALVATLEKVKQRRYPLYWDSRSGTGEKARRLLAQLGGTVLPADSADELFPRLLDATEALDRLAQPSLTTAMALAKLKRMLPDPVRAIEVRDLVIGYADEEHARISAQPEFIEGLTPDTLDDLIREVGEEVSPLVQLVATGVRFDRSREHVEVWAECLQRLLQARTQPDGQSQQALEQLKHYPALLVLRGAALVCVLRGYDDVLMRLFTEPNWRDRFNADSTITAVQALHDYRVLDPANVNALPRWNGTRWLYPTSHLLRSVLREPLRDLIPDDAEYTWTFDRCEYRTALAVYVSNERGSYRAAPGEFIGERSWNFDGVPRAEADFRRAADKADDDWAWWPLVGGRLGLEETLVGLRSDLSKMQKWG